MAPVAPDATNFRARGMGTFAIGCIPTSRAAIVATYFDDPRLVGVAAGHPVKTVAAEIHDATALIEIAIEDVEAAARPVFGMRPRHDHRVAIEQGPAFALQILVGDNVVIDTDML
jgi:hypothetical protein